MARIEIAQRSDIPQLVDLLHVLFLQEADFIPDRDKQTVGLQMIIDSPHTGVIFIARDDNQISGMVSLLFTISTALGAPVCWLEDMVIHPNQRGNGLGSQLMEHAIQYAKLNGYRRITLLTDQVNSGAQRFYRRLGFTDSSMIALRLSLLD